MADWPKPCLQRLEHLLLAEVCELLPETLEVAKSALVNEADETEEFQ